MNKQTEKMINEIVSEITVTVDLRTKPCLIQAIKDFMYVIHADGVAEGQKENCKSTVTNNYNLHIAITKDEMTEDEIFENCANPHMACLPERLNSDLCCKNCTNYKPKNKSGGKIIFHLDRMCGSK